MFLIKMYTGTIGSGKSYHALEDILMTLNKGKYVIANFPLRFKENQIKKGINNRFMYIDENLMGTHNGMSILTNIVLSTDNLTLCCCQYVTYIKIDNFKKFNNLKG